MLEYFLSLIWLFLPAGAANMAASLSKFIPFLNYPLDFGLTFRSRPLLGSHKTWRGLFFGLLAAWLLAYWQVKQVIFAYAFFDYSQINFWLWGLLLGAGAILGDAIRSFIKRRLGIMPGHPWFPYDQIDWVIGAGVLASFYVPISWDKLLVAIILATLIHPAVNYFCYIIHLQKNKF
ncbi:MAG: CDP-archaeol synthase [Patescibacteria group bacterium]|nr:CDP-archaeol synthase [Patescibacteria group bacterium]